jgi:hypothetical protein
MAIASCRNFVADCSMTSGGLTNSSEPLRRIETEVHIGEIAVPEGHLKHVIVGLHLAQKIHGEHRCRK